MKHHPFFRLLVCGGRTYSDTARMDEVLASAHEHHGKALVICHGGAPGADSLAGLWASKNGVPCISMVAPWHCYKKSAGTIRNTWMLSHLQPDAVCAFPGGPGTAHMIGLARRAGLHVHEIR